MASDNEYATIAQVTGRVENLDSTVVADTTTMDQFISNAEALINAKVGKKYSTTVPPFIEGLTITIAAFYAWSANPEGAGSVSYASLVSDMLWAEMQQGLKLLGDERFVNELGGS